jgi:hypothetical protein
MAWKLKREGTYIRRDPDRDYAEVCEEAVIIRLDASELRRLAALIRADARRVRHLSELRRQEIRRLPFRVH